MSEKNKLPTSLNLSLTLREIPVTLERNGKKEQYVLKELNGQDRDAHLNDSTGRVKMLADTPVVKDFKGMQADLVARSLYTVPGNERMSADAINRDFPASVIEALYNAARELSGLDAAAEDAEGND